MNIKQLEIQLNNLEKAFLQFAENGVIQTQAVDKNKSDITELKPKVEKVSETTTQTEDALCEMDDTVTTMLAEIQDALCELDERLSESEV